MHHPNEKVLDVFFNNTIIIIIIIIKNNNIFFFWSKSIKVKIRF